MLHHLDQEYSTMSAITRLETSQMFKRYAIVSNADQREAMAKLDQVRDQLGDDLGDDPHTEQSTALRGDAGKIQ
jgi:hypothetical protein